MKRSKRFRRAVLLSLCVLAGVFARHADAQLPAFPGAEGVAKFVTGGRGGDVYKVTNLNDSGVGSLRFGIQNAPGNGRTIVFDVAGTIHLQSRLSFGGKDNITIAGQTAPAGGVTIARHELNIDNANNVIVQYLRFRPGDRTAATHSPNPAPTYDPDGIWVQTSTNVMIDHVTASWGVDENLSTTHGSNNVTVQWSMISQGLFEGGHSEGSGHAFGSLVNGHNYTYHHNLYAHSNSRNPRPQISEGNELHLDWVNNVLYNPHDQFGNSSGDAYYMNYVANYGVKGPQTNSGTNFLMSPGNGSSHIYHADNYVDFDRDGILDGAVATAGQVVRPSHTYIAEPARLFPLDLPMVNTSSAQDAYVQVLSRAGASHYRDSVDHRLVRSLVNQMTGQINTQADWGGWPALPSGIAAADSNSDGVPDGWATINGFSTSTPLHQTTAPSGYSYLEEYIHSLTPNAYSPASIVQHTIRTSHGNGADAQINENGGLSAASSGNGSAGTISVHWDGTSGTTNQAALLRFDLAQIETGSIDAARLELTAASAIAGTHQFKVYGVVHDTSGWDWNENSVHFATAPGVDFDGNSRTLGIDARYTANGAEATQSNLPLPAPDDLLTLGTFTINGATAGQTLAFENLNLAVFLNLTAFYEDSAMAGLATIIVEQINSSTEASFWSKEGNASLAPRLVVDAVLSPMPVLAGDYNNDGAVDPADYVVWRKAMAGGIMLANETASPGIVDNEDFDEWKGNFGATSGEGSSANAAVPEPSSLAAAFGLLAIICGFQRLRLFGHFLQK
jgi:pectate lyase